LIATATSRRPVMVSTLRPHQGPWTQAPIGGFDRRRRPPRRPQFRRLLPQLGLDLGDGRCGIGGCVDHDLAETIIRSRRLTPQDLGLRRIAGSGEVTVDLAKVKTFSTDEPIMVKPGTRPCARR
jgi:hypothetical protein